MVRLNLTPRSDVERWRVISWKKINITKMLTDTIYGDDGKLNKSVFASDFQYVAPKVFQLWETLILM